PSSCVLSPSVAHRVLHSFPTRRSSDLEIHMAVFLFLAGQPSRNAEARLLGAPIQDSEHAYGLTGIAPKRPDPGITGDTVPLHIIGMGDVPQKWITDRRIRFIEDRLAHIQHLL